jgi:N-acetylmuramoyl-L-alanine amidase
MNHFASALAATLLFIPLAAPQKTVMLDPAGHAKQPGRKLFESLERAETLKCAEAIKKAIEQASSMRVVLTRAPGDVIVPLQNASFANRSKADLFITIHLYKEIDERPSVQLYHRLNDPLLDGTKTYGIHEAVPINQAHCLQLKKTRSLGAAMLKQLKDKVGGLFVVANTMLGLPITALEGITCPALCLEIGVHKDNDWVDLIEPLAVAIITLLAQ